MARAVSVDARLVIREVRERLEHHRARQLRRVGEAEPVDPLCEIGRHLRRVERAEVERVRVLRRAG